MSVAHMVKNTQREEQNKEDLDWGSPLHSIAAETVIESRLEHLKMLVRMVLEELNSLQELRSDKKFQLTLPREVDRFEEQLIRNALLMSFGAQRRAARILGINPTTLHAKIKRFKIELPTETGSTLESADAAIDESTTGWPVSFNDARTKFETRIIQQALEQTGGSLTRAAELLKLPIPTLHYKVQKLGIDPFTFSTKRRGIPFSNCKDQLIYGSDIES
jgi:DNA-binding NtrC family response regulator